MSMDLTSESGAKANLGAGAWDLYLWLADSYGWKRAGTLPPPGVAAGAWEGSYGSNDGQLVTEPDAAAIAAALQRSLADPDRAVRQRDVIRRLNAEVRGLALELEGIELPDESETESLPTDAELRDVIQFLEKGAFRIE